MKRERYRIVDGKKLIEVRVRSALQLFDSRDPAPFRDRDIDDDFMEYILASVEEFGRNPFKVCIYVEEPATTGLSNETVTEAIQTHLDYQVELKRSQLAKLFRTVRLFLGIGLIFLVICIGLAKLIHTKDSELTIAGILREGIVIFGWVSMWKPFELILFDWYPLYDRIQLLQRLRRAEIDVQFGHQKV